MLGQNIIHDLFHSKNETKNENVKASISCYFQKAKLMDTFILIPTTFRFSPQSVATFKKLNHTDPLSLILTG